MNAVLIIPNCNDHRKDTNIMKNKTKQNTNGNSKGSHSVKVKFEDPTATSVAIAGTFNNWRPEATHMVPLGDGRWLKVLVLPPGTYEYLLIVDGSWLPDPLAKKTVPNAFGGVNSVFDVPNGENLPDRKI